MIEISAAITNIGTAFLFLSLVGLLTFFAFRTYKQYLLILSTAAISFLAFYWIIQFRDIIGFALGIITGGNAIYVGYCAVDLLLKRGKPS